MSETPSAETTCGEEKKGEGGAFSGLGLNLDSPLSRRDLQLFNQSLRAGCLVDVPAGWSTKAAARLLEDFETAPSRRQRQSIFKTLLLCEKHNFTVLTFGMRAQDDPPPVSAPAVQVNVQNNTVQASGELSPQDRRRTLSSPSDALAQVSSDPALSALYRELQERRARGE